MKTKDDRILRAEEENQTIARKLELESRQLLKIEKEVNQLKEQVRVQLDLFKVIRLKTTFLFRSKCTK